MSKELIERLRNAAIFATSECAWLMTEAADALEAKAAPVGEREAAIDWYNNADWGNECFKDGVVRGFQAGAAYQRAQQPQSEYGDAYQGSREDLAIWKRRALEAEARIREQDQIIENLGNALNAENGPTFMGEPVIRQPQSAEAVAYVLTRDGEVCYEADDGIVISNTPGDETDLYKWQPVYFTTPLPIAGVVTDAARDVLAKRQRRAERNRKQERNQ